MASAPIVVPYALSQLAEGVSLDASLTTAQTVFTSQNGTKCFPMFIVFRDAAHAINAGTTFNVGNTGSATAYYSASTVLQSMLTTTGPIFLPLYGSTVGTSVGYLAQNQVVTVTFGGTLTSNSNVKVDVLGYYAFT